jgi:hypothetical protein
MVQHWLLAEFRSLWSVAGLSGGKETLGVGRRRDPPQLPRQLLLPSCCGISAPAIGLRMCY